MTDRRRPEEWIMQFLYPARCPVCHGIAPAGCEICPECRKRMPGIAGKRCLKCGKPVDEAASLCDDCQRYRRAFAEGIGVFLYDDVMRETMRRLKYKGRREYGRVLGHVLADAAADKLAKWQPDALVPVPLSLRRMISRTYNQAQEIAEGVSEKCGIPVISGAMRRTKDTKAMKELGRAERRANLENVFSADAELVRGLAITLIDDIFTTGATVDACAAALAEAGAGPVYFITVCIGGGYLTQY